MRIRWQVLICLGAMYAGFASYYQLWLGGPYITHAGVFCALVGLWTHALLRAMARAQSVEWPSVLQRPEGFWVLVQCFFVGLLIHLTCRTAKSDEVSALFASSGFGVGLFLPFFINDALLRLVETFANRRSR